MSIILLGIGQKPGTGMSQDYLHLSEITKNTNESGAFCVSG